MDNEDKKAAVKHEYATRQAMVTALDQRFKPIFVLAATIILTYIVAWLKLEFFGLSNLFEKIVFVVSFALSLGVITISAPLLFALRQYKNLAKQ